MKKLKKITALLPLLVSISFACISCKEKEPERITYYDVIGEGYAFMYDSAGNILHPLRANIRVVSRITWRLTSFTTSQPEDFFFIDAATGKYQLRFIKQYEGDEPEWYTLYFSNSTEYFGSFGVTIDEVKNARNTIKLDTFKVYKALAWF